MAERLTVVLYGTKVGTLTRLFPGADPEFAYDSHYLEHFSTPISLRMPPPRGTVQTSHCQPIHRELGSRRSRYERTVE
jgi:HipA-like protein